MSFKSTQSANRGKAANDKLFRAKHDLSHVETLRQEIAEWDSQLRELRKPQEETSARRYDWRAMEID